MNNPKPRRQYWINPPFQTRIVRAILLFVLVIVGETGLFAALVAYVLLNPAAVQGSMLTYMSIALFAAAISVSAIFVWLGVRISHRICGPIYRVIKDLEAVRRGEKKGPIRLRKGDEFQELAAALNETFDVFKEPAAPKG